MGTPISRVRNVALVAHDNCKPNLVNWVKTHAARLIPHHLVCTGTTGRLVEKALSEAMPECAGTLSITLLKSGPLGGDQQLGARIADGQVDMLVFFWDPMEAQPHDVDVKALLRIASLYNLPCACNMASADYIITSPLMVTGRPYAAYDFSHYADRTLK